MRPITFLALLVMFASCRSHKEIQKDISVTTDSVAHSSHHRTMAQIDSAVIRGNFDFDTLCVTIERPVADMPPEVIRVKAVKGKITHSKEQRKLAAAHEERLDTLAYKISSADKSAEHSATTRVYDPPNATGIILFALLIIGGVAYMYFHRKIDNRACLYRYFVEYDLEASQKKCYFAYNFTFYTCIMKFILSRVDDYKFRSKKWMLGYATLFWLISRIIVMILMVACVVVYEQFGISPQELTSFGGDPSVTLSSNGLIKAILMVALIAPIFEEFLFRFGLSFRRISVGISVACVALFPAISHNKTSSPTMWIVSAVLAIATFCSIYFTTTDDFWQKLKKKWLIPAVWFSSIAFGLAHLFAFSNLDWTLLPYAFVMILTPFFAGCSCAYLRVNMGFGWGIAMHIFNNIPGIIMMICG